MNFGPFDYRIASGKIIDISDLQIGDMSIEDIATSMSRQFRFNGMTDAGWDICQHSVAVTLLLRSMGYPPQVQLHGLLHDAHESITGDIISPVKHLIGDRIKEIENDFDRVLFKQFGVVRHDEIIKAADAAMFRAEYHVLFTEEGEHDHRTVGIIEHVAHECLEHESMHMFLGMFNAIVSEMAAMEQAH